MPDNALKDIHWHGDTLEVVHKFAKLIRMTIGAELYLLQIGEGTGFMSCMRFKRRFKRLRSRTLILAGRDLERCN